MPNLTRRCLCGEDHLLPESGRVWFLHPENAELAMRLLDSGNVVVPCRLVSKEQAQNVDAAYVRDLLATMPVAEIVE